MTRILFIVIFLFNLSVLDAQKGILISYEQVSIPKFLKPDGTVEDFDQELLNILKRPTIYDLQIVDHQSMYSKVERINNTQGGGEVIMSGLLPKNSFYDFKNNIKKQEWDMDIKQFIVVDSIPALNYQLTRNKSKFLGYDVKKAVLQNANSTVSVWYAPALPAKFGPSTFVNFPGLVLNVEIVDKNEKEPRFTLKATEIKLDDNVELKKLFKGKEITATEFKKIEEDFQKAKREDYSGVDRD